MESQRPAAPMPESPGLHTVDTKMRQRFIFIGRCIHTNTEHRTQGFNPAVRRVECLHYTCSCAKSEWLEVISLFSSSWLKILHALHPVRMMQSHWGWHTLYVSKYKTRDYRSLSSYVDKLMHDWLFVLSYQSKNVQILFYNPYRTPLKQPHLQEDYSL